MWTTEDHGLHRFTNAGSKHALAQVHGRTQQNARERRPLTDALAKVPQKTPLGTGHIYIYVYIDIEIDR